MAIHDQAAKLREDVGDVPDREDAIDYDGLKASVGRIYLQQKQRTRQANYAVDVAAANVKMARNLADILETNRCQCDLRAEAARGLLGYLTDVCSVHDIDIPEADEDDD